MERYESYKDSGAEWIGEIPSHWKASRLRNCLSKNQGGLWGNDPVEGNATVVLRSTDQTLDGEWAISDSATRDLSGESNVESKFLKEGDLLVAKSSGSEKHIGKTTIVNRAIEEMHCSYSNFMQRLRTNTSMLARYCWYILNSDIARSQYRYLQNSTSGLGNLNADSISAVIVPIPPIGEQRAITSYLDKKVSEVDLLVDEVERSIELLEEYRKSVISEAVTKGLNPNVPMKDSGIAWIGGIPEGWMVARLGELAYIRARIGWRALKAEEYVDDGYPMYSAYNINDGVFSPYPVNYISRERYLESPEIMMKKGDIMLVKDGAGVGKQAVIRDSIPECTVNGSIALITPHDDLDSIFLSYYLESNSFQHFAHMLMGGMGVPHLFQRDIKLMKVVLPPVEEQKDIANYLDKISFKIHTLADESNELIRYLKQYRKSLIAECVTGKVKVPGVE